MTDHYAVIGNPIAHSQSPAIHAAFAIQTGQPIEYTRILGNLDDFAGDVRDFIAAGGRGLNITVPFKEEAWRLLEDLNPRAAIAQAVNTLIVLDGGRLRGDNTDGIGLIHDLAYNHGFSFLNRSVLVLGAGGAARGLVQPLLETGLATLTIANRTVTKAVTLAERMQQFGTVYGIGFEQLSGRQFDLIINATSTGLSQEHLPLPNDCLAENAWVYDLSYGANLTPFCQWGKTQGAERVCDGLGMLVEQAAESFLLWRGLRPDTAHVIEMLRQQITSN
jgi:shikimate dehydrogenase